VSFRYLLIVIVKFVKPDADAVRVSVVQEFELSEV